MQASHIKSLSVGGVISVENFVHSEHDLDFTGASQSVLFVEAVGGCRADIRIFQK